MAISDNLIRGAAVAADRFVDVGGAVAAGMASVPMSRSRSPKAQKIDKVNSDVKTYVDSLNTDMDLIGLSNEEQSSIRSYLQNKRMEYAQMATELSQIDAISPYYSQLKGEMDSIKNSFKSLSKQITTFKERKAQYHDDFDKGMFSKGNDPEQYEKAAKVYAGGYLNISNDGELYIVSKDGKDIVNYSEIKDPNLVDRKTANEILKTADSLYNSGAKLNPYKEKMFRNQTAAILAADGALESIVNDGIIDSMPIEIDLDQYETRGDAIDAVTDILVQGYKKSAEQGYMAKQQKINTRRRTSSSGEPDSSANEAAARLKGYPLRSFQEGQLAAGRMAKDIEEGRTSFITSKDFGNIMVGSNENYAGVGPAMPGFYVMMGDEKANFDTREKAINFALSQSGEDEFFIKGFSSAGESNETKPPSKTEELTKGFLN